MLPHLLVNLAGDGFLVGEVRQIPPGDVEHVGVDWNRARLVEGHEKDAVGNLEENSRFLQETGGYESVTVGTKRKCDSGKQDEEYAIGTLGPTPASCISSALASSSGLSRRLRSQDAPPKDISL